MNVRKIISIVMIFCLWIVITGCGVKESILVKEKSTPFGCKMVLNCGYLFQDNEKAQEKCIEEFGKACNTGIAKRECKNYEKKSMKEIDRLRLSNCKKNYL